MDTEKKEFLKGASMSGIINNYLSLLRSNPREEDLQKFFAFNPQLLFGLFGQGDEGDIGFITKPHIGTSFNADFAILNFGQCGCTINLIEIEKSHAALFTKNNTPSKQLQIAIGQLLDWKQWIIRNRLTFVNDLIELVKNFPMFPRRTYNGSFRLKEPQEIEYFWKMFAGFDDPVITYTIIIGDWNMLTENHKKRLLFYNRKDNQFYKIYTYNEVARRAKKHSSFF